MIFHFFFVFFIIHPRIIVQYNNVENFIFVTDDHKDNYIIRNNGVVLFFFLIER